MPYYLAPYIGAGTEEDPFRPLGSDQPGWAAIDLRPDASTLSGLNMCLLFLPNADPDAQLRQLSDAVEEVVTTGTRDAINTRLGSTITTGKLSDVIADLLINPPANRWKALQASRGKFEIWLGGRIYEAPVIRGGVEGSDNFNRPNSDDTSVSWVGYLVGGNPAIGRIVNGRVRAGSITLQMEAAFERIQPGSADCFAQCDVVTWNGGNPVSSIFVMLRGAAGGGLREFYTFGPSRDNTPLNGWELSKRIAGAFTALDFNGADSFLAGDKVQFQVIGSTLTPMRSRGSTWAEVVTTPVTDTSLPSAGRSGMRVQEEGSLPDTEADNFLTGSGPLPRKFILSH